MAPRRLLLRLLVPLVASLSAGVVELPYEVLREITVADVVFTQGLSFDRGALWQSGGLYGRSSLRRISTEDGRILAEKRLDGSVFAEGIAEASGEIVVLTWKERKAFRLSTKDLSDKGVFPYEGEGWGLTRHKGAWVQSDGSDRLTFRDDAFRPLRRVSVTLAGEPLRRLNELESCPKGILANVWYRDFIVLIGDSGEVSALIDASVLVRKAGGGSGENVLNGVAWDPSRETLWVTGKNWNRLYEIRPRWAALR